MGRRAALRGGPEVWEVAAVAGPGLAGPDLDELDRALHERFLSRRETANRADLGSVLVANRQQAQQIADCRYAEPLEPFGNARTDASSKFANCPSEQFHPRSSASDASKVISRVL